ncbi:hypothetical protein BLNAU_20226 [Blattamonas nauphoetae]|uniref:Uncharacterized protein n=1 Tax=Blattamonas nauphoetae TaxID=2049346 RepID=A0ABQ9X0G0_9EUKA|nr:hypothetical protein BLNAU_20226 [Blattamonas nauphoetae]
MYTLPSRVILPNLSILLSLVILPSLSILHSHNLLKIMHLHQALSLNQHNNRPRYPRRTFNLLRFSPFLANQRKRKRRCNSQHPIQRDTRNYDRIIRLHHFGIFIS